MGRDPSWSLQECTAVAADVVTEALCLDCKSSSASVSAFSPSAQTSGAAGARCARQANGVTPARCGRRDACATVLRSGRVCCRRHAAMDCLDKRRRTWHHPGAVVRSRRRCMSHLQSWRTPGQGHLWWRRALRRPVCRRLARKRALPSSSRDLAVEAAAGSGDPAIQARQRRGSARGRASEASSEAESSAKAVGVTPTRSTTAGLRRVQRRWRPLRAWRRCPL